MLELLIGQDTAVITLLLLFITGLLTKRFVPWWVHEELLKKLAEYEDTAPELITEVRRLMTIIEQGKQNEIQATAKSNNPHPSLGHTIRIRRVQKGAKRHAHRNT